jgi:hypothetical protein
MLDEFLFWTARYTVFMSGFPVLTPLAMELSIMNSVVED